MRFLKYLASASALVLGLYLIVGENLAGVSVEAVVNAELNYVRAPIAGEFSENGKRVGSRVERDETLGAIHGKIYEGFRLSDAEARRAAADLEINALTRQVVTLVEARSAFDAQESAYRVARQAQSDAKVADAQADEKANVARVAEAELTFGRTAQLHAKGYAAQATADATRVALEVARQTLERAKQKVLAAQSETAALQRGVFTGDSYNDLPYAGQKSREIDVRLSETRDAIAAARARREEAERLVTVERKRLIAMTTRELRAPVSGLVWQTQTHDAENVSLGQEIMRIVDCERVFVTASVKETLYNTLAVGAPAQFRVLGDDRVHSAVIVRLGGSGALTLYQTLAVAPSRRHLEEYDVLLSVPGLSGPQGGCPIGRTGRVVFEAGPLTIARRYVEKKTR